MKLRVPQYGSVGKVVWVDDEATKGAIVGVNLYLSDGKTLVTDAMLSGGSSSGSSSGITTTDDLNEGKYRLYFTTRRAQDAVGGILANSANVSLSYAGGTSITADLIDQADSGVGAALVKITRDSKGRVSGTSAATTADLAEGSNLYYTDARADARITAQKGIANGLAPLGGDGKINISFLPASVLGQVSYQGTWDASAGTPPTTTPQKGWYYIVTVAGATNLGGITDWKVGDWAIYDVAWDKVDNTDAISTWNGRTGAVVPQAGDYTPAMVGAEPAITAGTTAQYWRGDKTWRDLATDVRAAVLTGLSTATSAVIAATDTVLGALGKLQAQITDNLLPQGYIDGLNMVWVSGTALTVTTGAAYIPSLGKVLRVTADISKTGLSLTASTWYHVYLYSNAGTPDVEISTTAPATAYNGTARTKTADTSRRYVGSVLSDASGNIYRFQQNGSEIEYVVNTTAPFRVVSGGVATTRTSIDLSGAIPVTSDYVVLSSINNDTVRCLIDIPEIGNSGNISRYNTLGGQRNPIITAAPSRVVQYLFDSTPTASGFFLDVWGYRYSR